MPKSERSYDDQLRAIYEAMADSVADASDEDILLEVRELGEDPDSAAETVKGLLRNATKAFLQRRLREAREAHSDHVREIRAKKIALPPTPERRLALLKETCERAPELQLAFRDFTELTGADVEGLLRQLAHLGFLKEVPPPAPDQP